MHLLASQGLGYPTHVRVHPLLAAPCYNYTMANANWCQRLGGSTSISYGIIKLICAHVRVCVAIVHVPCLAFCVP